MAQHDIASEAGPRRDRLGVAGPEGMRTKNGQPLRFTYVNTGDDAAGKAVTGGTFCQVYCSDSGLIKSGVNDPKNDALVRSVNTLPTTEQQYAKATEVEVTTLNTYGVMPTVNLPTITAVKTGLANVGAGRFFTATPENIGWQK